MKKLSFDQMENVHGKAYHCLTFAAGMLAAFGGGIVASAGGILVMAASAGDCHRQFSKWADSSQAVDPNALYGLKLGNNNTYQGSRDILLQK